MTDEGQRRDVRPRLLSAVLADKHLSAREKVYMVTVLSVSAEQTPTGRRHGSQAMNARGVYSLHVDYIARCMGATTDTVRRTRQALQSSRWLDQVHPGRFGRPTTYQALLAGSERAPLRGGTPCHPYETAELPPPYARR